MGTRWYRSQASAQCLHVMRRIDCFHASATQCPRLMWQKAHASRYDDAVQARTRCPYRHGVEGNRNGLEDDVQLNGWRDDVDRLRLRLESNAHDAHLESAGWHGEPVMAVRSSPYPETQRIGIDDDQRFTNRSTAFVLHHAGDDCRTLRLQGARGDHDSKQQRNGSHRVSRADARSTQWPQPRSTVVKAQSRTCARGYAQFHSVLSLPLHSSFCILRR